MDATFWALVGLILFLALIILMKVPGRIVTALDKRSDSIKEQLDEARASREEAQKNLANSQRTLKKAEKEAEEIVEEAKRESKRLLEEADAELDDLVARRTKSVEQKIAQAESKAVAEVRAKAVDIAVEVAENIILQQMVGEKAEEFTADSIGQVQKNLH